MTQLSPRFDSFGAGSQRWLGSKRGTNEARTFTIDVTASANNIVNGVIPAGTAFHIPNATTPAVPAGGSNVDVYNLTDVPVVPGAGNVVTAGIDHGRIVVAHLPKDANGNPSPVTSSSTGSGQFIYV